MADPDPAIAGPGSRKIVTCFTMPTTLAVDLTNLDTFVGAVPHDQFDLLRREAPIFFHEERDGAGFWCITRYDDLHTISQQHPVFSSEWGITAARGH